MTGIIPIALSRRQIKTMDRVGGANLILDWPEGLPPGTPLKPDCEREATPEERAIAIALVRDACAGAGLVPMHVRVVNVLRPPDYPRGDSYEQHLAVLITGQRWVHAIVWKTPPDLWPTAPKDQMQ